MIRSIGFVLVAVCLLAATAQAATPTSMSVQGRLTDAAGVPLSAGAKTFIFRIYNSQIGGSQLWPAAGGEVQSITSGTDGLWIGLVGAITPLTDPIFADSVRWLEINVSGTTLPRVRLVTGPYAFRVATVDGASGGNITSKVSIGQGHTNTGIDGFVIGLNNQVLGDFASVTGGTDNVASGRRAFIGSGDNNVASDTASIVLGGYDNSVSKSFSVASGGNGNTVSERLAVIAGGLSNSVSGFSSTVGGGDNNFVSGHHGVIAGGREDSVFGDFSTIGGGNRNNIHPGDYSTIAGGTENLVSGAYASIGGGNSNVAGFASAVGGGQSNKATATNAATISGGTRNTADGSFSAIGGGYYNKTYGIYSVIGGGGGSTDVDSNSAKGEGATIPGGSRNSTNGNFSFAAGRRAKANHDGTFVWADSTEADFTSTADDQFLIRAGGGVGIGTNAPDGPLHVQEGSAGAVTANGNSVAVFERNGHAYLQMLTPDANESGLIFGIASATTGGAVMYNSAAVPGGLEFRTNTNDFAVAINSAGDVGIGDNTPNAKLDVVGDAIVAGTLNVATTTGALIVPRMSTAQRNALAAVNGMIIYNTGTNQFNFHENGVWVTK